MSAVVADGSPPQAPPVKLRGNVATLVEMVVRPDRFFPKLVAAYGERFPFVTIWIVGAGTAVDRLDSQMVMENFRRTLGVDRPYAVLGDWTATWVSVILGGLISGLLIWLLLGWWYRVRLMFCGARPPKRAARNVFIYANLIGGVVSLTLLALQTPFHASYREAWSSDVVPWGWMFVPFWSVWLSYRGVVSSFDARPVAARVWFLILPWLVYGGLMAILFTIGLVGVL